jgi:glycosyltransferase involved in cell wall biosynthesis
MVIRSAIWHSTALLRRLVDRAPFLSRFIRRALKVLEWIVNLELHDKLSVALAARLRRHAEQRELAKMTLPPLVFDERRCFSPAAELIDRNGPWPSDRPLVSVVITSFNYGRFLVEAVDAVLAQTFRDLEVIVVEGGSTDQDSRSVAAGLSRPRTRVVFQPEPHQAGANRNFGISNARGKYICCLDADDLLKPTYIEKAVFLLESHGYDVVSCATQQFGEETGRVSLLSDPVLADMLEGNHVITCAVFLRDFWIRAGGYRDTDRAVTGHVHEDWLFWAHLSALGARIHNMSEDYLFLYRRHGPSLSSDPQLHRVSVQGALIRKILAGLVDPAALRNSRLAAAADRRPDDPPVNVIRSSLHDLEQPSLLLVLPLIIIGGAERLLSAVVAHLVRQGWRVTIMTTIDPEGSRGDATEWFEAATSEIFHLPRFLARERWSGFVDYVVSSRRVDVMWIVGSAFAYELLPQLRTRRPHLRVADLLFNTVRHTRNNRKHAALIDVTFVENREVEGYLLNAGETPDRIMRCSSGVDLGELRPGVPDPGVVERLGVGAEELIVGYSGRWSQEKDPLAFIEIARKAAGLPIRFVMTGAGPLQPRIEKALAKAMLGPRFHLAGAVADVTPWIRSYDALVLPSRLDGRPVVVLEALALGVPVIASAVGGLPDLIQDGIQGFLCRPGAVDEFVDRLRTLSSDRELLGRMKAAAREFALRHLDQQDMLGRYERRLRELVVDSRELPHDQRQLSRASRH